MAERKGRGGIVDGQVIATVKDKYGEDRKVVKRGNRIRVANTEATAIFAMNREVAVLMSAKIRAARIARGFSLEELAVRMGIVSGNPKDRMYEIENSSRKHGIRLGTLYAAAAALNVEVMSLLPTVAEVLAGADVQRATAKVVTLSPRGRVLTLSKTA